MTGRDERESPWRARVLAVLAAFPEGTTISRLTRPLADGAHDYDSMYDRIYQALRACEKRGYVRRMGFVDRRVEGSWDVPGGNGFGYKPVSWKVTLSGADYLAASATAACSSSTVS